MDPQFSSVQVGAGAPAPLLVHPDAAFPDASEVSPSLDDPPLETCKRELDAVLASLDPEPR